MWLLVLVLFDCLTLNCVKLNSCVVVFLGLFVIIILHITLCGILILLGGDSSILFLLLVGVVRLTLVFLLSHVLQNSSAQVILYSTHLGEFQNKKRNNTKEIYSLLPSRAVRHHNLNSLDWRSFCLLSRSFSPVAGWESSVFRVVCY